jgi:hypothetical protein
MTYCARLSSSSNVRPPSEATVNIINEDAELMGYKRTSYKLLRSLNVCFCNRGSHVLENE